MMTCVPSLLESSFGNQQYEVVVYHTTRWYGGFPDTDTRPLDLVARDFARANRICGCRIEVHNLNRVLSGSIHMPNGL